MNSISRNKYIDKSATLLKAYFTLASCCGRAQTTHACVYACVCTCIRPFNDEEACIQSRMRDKERERTDTREACTNMQRGNEWRRNREEKIYVYTGCLWSEWLTLECIMFSFQMIKMFIFFGVEEWIHKISYTIYNQLEKFSYT